MSQPMHVVHVEPGASLLPLTEAQLGLWYAQRLDPSNPIFNTAHAVEIQGPLVLSAFEQAVNEALREVDAFALRMVDTPEGPKQRVDDAQRPLLQRIELSGAADPVDAARKAMHRDGTTPIDPTRDRLVAQVLFVLGAERFLWYQRIHHLAIDGFGFNLLTRRVADLYAGGLGARIPGPALAPLHIVNMEDEAYRSSERRALDAIYWKEHLQDCPEVIGMAAGRAVTAHTAHRLALTFEPSITQALLHLADVSAVAWPDVLTTLAAAYCQRMIGAPQIVIGVPHMGRLGTPAARVPAMLMNVLPVRVQIDEQLPLTAVCVSLSKALVRARRHGRYRSEQIRRDLGLLGGVRRLYGPIINVLPFDQPPAFAGVSSRLEILGTGPVDDVTFTFRGDAVTGLSCEIEANPGLYSRDETEAHAHRLIAFIQTALSAGTLEPVPTASPLEARRYIFDVNATGRPVPRTTLTALIEQSMQRMPTAIAVTYGSRTLTYQQLNERTAALAAELRKSGIGEGDIVAVALPRSLELIIALVAVLRAGAAYLPLDLQHPRERLIRIVTSAQAHCALINTSDISVFAGALTALPTDKWPEHTASWSAASISPHAAAYVIYTSGSTGEPKGVVIEHQSIVNRLEWMREHYGFSADDRILQKTPATFDVSVWEFFLPLITGARLVVAPPDAHRDPRALVELIQEHGITTAHFVPSMLSAFLDEASSAGLTLARVFCSGEELAVSLRDRFHAHLHAELHNLYGPTEAAVDVSYWPASAQDRSLPVPIGFPVWNTRFYILDDHMRPVPPGIVGHLFISGVQVARGYLGRQDLTDERFTQDPFVTGSRMYRTGDLARWRPDGAVVFLGRSDHQVKVRGLRIELGEIEAALMASGLVRHTAVIVREDRTGERRIVAYVVAAEDFDRETLKARLSARLPDYMVPAAFVQLESLPVTRNGKLDRAALPAPEFRASAGRTLSTDTEHTLAAIFHEVLGLGPAPLDADADFFALGGDSLLAIRLLRKIQNLWGHDPGLGTVFTHPTIAALASIVDSRVLMIDNGLGTLVRLAAPANDSAHACPIAQDASPLFLVHPAGGISWCYRNLARALSSVRPVYGLQAPTLDLHSPVPESIDALAADYIRQIRSVVETGPYHLAGWSVGGIIAHAMATQLQSMGHEVRLLALLDAYPSDCWRAEPEPDPVTTVRALLTVAGYNPQHYPDLMTRDAIVQFLRHSGSALGSLPETVLEGVIRTVLDTNRLVRRHYHARYSGRLTHIRAARDHAGRNLTPALWAPYAESLDTVDVPFLHAELTGAEAAEHIAPALQSRLDS